MITLFIHYYPLYHCGKEKIQGQNLRLAGGTKALSGLAPLIGVHRDIYASSVKNNNKTKINFYNHLYLLLPTLPLWQGKETWPKYTHGGTKALFHVMRQA